MSYAMWLFMIGQAMIVWNHRKLITFLPTTLTKLARLAEKEVAALKELENEVSLLTSSQGRTRQGLGTWYKDHLTARPPLPPQLDKKSSYFSQLLDLRQLDTRLMSLHYLSADRASTQARRDELNLSLTRTERTLKIRFSFPLAFFVVGIVLISDVSQPACVRFSRLVCLASPLG
jgi:hypothetical protein